MTERNRDDVPAVTPRRRIFDTSTWRVRAGEARAHATSSSSLPAEPDEERAPPSSVDAARARCGLRPEELRRADAIVRADDETSPWVDRGVEREKPALPARIKLVLPEGKELTLKELASRVGIAVGELLATLVTRGYYALSASSKLPEDSVRTIASMLGWELEPSRKAPTVTPTPKKRAKALAPVRSVATRRAKAVRSKAAASSKIKTPTKRIPAPRAPRRSP